MCHSSAHNKQKLLSKTLVSFVLREIFSCIARYRLSIYVDSPNKKVSFFLSEISCIARYRLSIYVDSPNKKALPTSDKQQVSVHIYFLRTKMAYQWNLLLIGPLKKQLNLSDKPSKTQWELALFPRNVDQRLIHMR